MMRILVGGPFEPFVSGFKRGYDVLYFDLTYSHIPSTFIPLFII